MARVLATYMDCPRQIRHAIMGEFDKSPSLTTIENMRKAYLADKPEPEAIRKNDGYYPGDISRSLEETSKRFLARIERERMASAIKSGRALEFRNVAWQRSAA